MRARAGGHGFTLFREDLDQMMVTWPQLGLFLLVVAVLAAAAGLFVGRRRPDWRAPIGTALKIAVVVLLAIVVLAVVTVLHKVPAAVTWTQLGAVVLVAAVVLLLSGGGFYLERKRPAWHKALDTALMTVTVLFIVLLAVTVAAAIVGRQLG
ncbi:hypothetical protein PV518_34465 [Streptomyces sp. ND04-05B]|uniref:hypothetical protein n=2 Tax=Streptomyces TaxID=1883 RepID=UPI0013C50B03|nr:MULTISPECIES: hypothetical protein [Streptomyces]MDX3067219.1 hypothetical protein [Streptomyces sp. ND04-05B]